MSRPLNTEGGGDRGNFMEIRVKPDSDLKTELTTMKNSAATTEEYQRMLLVWTNGANYQVGAPAADANPHGRIVSVREDKVNSSYIITARMWKMLDTTGEVMALNRIINVGSGEGTTIRELLEWINEIYPCKVTYEPSPLIEYDSIADISLARALLDFWPKMSKKNIKKIIKSEMA